MKLPELELQIEVHFGGVSVGFRVLQQSVVFVINKIRKVEQGHTLFSQILNRFEEYSSLSSLLLCLCCRFISLVLFQSCSSRFLGIILKGYFLWLGFIPIHHCCKSSPSCYYRFSTAHSIMFLMNRSHLQALQPDLRFVSPCCLSPSIQILHLGPFLTSILFLSLFFLFSPLHSFCCIFLSSHFSATAAAPSVVSPFFPFLFLIPFVSQQP